MKKILVIDDAEFILEGTATLLRFEGYEVVTASDGLKGAASASEHRPDLILCDVSMPMMDGYGVLEHIRREQTLATTPFIFLTARAEKSDMRTGMERGADDYLIKPFTRDELIAAIEAQWQKHSRIERQVQEKVEEVGKNITYALPHEFRTVLNEVINSAAYLKNVADNVTPSDVLELSDDIINSSRRLLKITENFLVYAQIETLTADKDARRLLRSMSTEGPVGMLMDIASYSAEKNGRNDDLVIENKLHSEQIEISSQNFHKILDELLDNAFKFSEAGTPVLIRLERDGNKVRIAISDRGRGMNPEQISNIGAYKQFERLMYEQQGVGLGLVIAKRLVELHDGEMNIESEENKGTTVTFTLHIAGT